MNLKSSILISLVSGAGFLAIIALAPTSKPSVEEGRDILPALESRKNPFQKALERAQTNSKEVRRPLLNLRIDPEEIRRFSDRSKTEFREVLGAGDFERSRYLDMQNFQWDRGFRGIREEFLKRSFYGRIGTMEVDAQFSRVPPKGMYEELAWGKYNRAPFRALASRQGLDFLDIKVPISSSVSAVFSFSSGDALDETNLNPQFVSYAFAGFQFKTSHFLSTRILARDRYVTMNSMNGPIQGSQVQEFRRMGWDERESLGLHNFEWQANLRPTKAVRLQTAIFNSPKENRSVSSLPDSGRMSLFLGEKNLFLNLRYTYQMSEQNLRNLSSPWQPRQDFASVGFLFFLDPSRNYSLYLGGNQFNITERIQGVRNPNQDSKLPPSFTASLRGNTGASENSNFFLNFQNQPPGFWGLGMPGFIQRQDRGTFSSDSFYEYATTLGVEVNF